MGFLLDPHERELPLLDQIFLVTSRLVALPTGMLMLLQNLQKVLAEIRLSVTPTTV